MKPKIGIITLGVSDLKRSLTFYRDGLGFPTHEYKEDAGIVFFKLEGTWLALYPLADLAKDLGKDAEKAGLLDDSLPLVKGAGGIPGGFSGVTLAHNEKTKEEVDATVQLAIKAGATLVKQPEDVFWGGYSGYFADPDGYLWEVAYNPFMDLT
jgi:catechol 2,3-dioxygenase-like lactoylglutathione lyase family enzyme